MGLGQRFAAEARKLAGTPYRHRGRLAGVALDCVGVLIVAMRACGIEVAEPEPYGTMPPSIVDRLGSHFVRVDEAQVGDVLAIMWGDQPRHCAVVSRFTIDGAPIVVHALARVGKVAEHTLSPGYRVHSIWRLKEAA